MLKFGNTFVNFGGTYFTDWTVAPEPPGPGPEPEPVILPTNTIRCKFSSGYTPTMGDTQTLVDADENIWDIYKESNEWISLFAGDSNLLEVLGANTTNVTNMNGMFAVCTSLTSVSIFNTSNVTYMNSMFSRCDSLTTVPLFDTSNVTDMKEMFYVCIALTTVPLFDTSNVTNMDSMFNTCNSLTTIPLFNTNKVNNMDFMFNYCINVQSGALALYQQASSQTTPPSNHRRTFYNCGSNTQTGSAELAQIPSNWK